jgi:hypothetical protein
VLLSPSGAAGVVTAVSPAAGAVEEVLSVAVVLSAAFSQAVRAALLRRTTLRRDSVRLRREDVIVKSSLEK